MKRSYEMVLVGYFLARCGEHESGKTRPPRVLGAESLSAKFKHLNRAFAS